ncbi:unnamed protein product [Aspergillus niger]|nr:unnamed protein product [Aspergillus niger]
MCGADDNRTRQRISEPEGSAQDGGTRPAFASDGIDQENARGSTFKVIEYNPPCDETSRPKNRERGGAQSQSAERQHQALSEFKRLICDLPRTETWKEWISVADPKREEFVRGLVEGFAPPDVLSALPRKSPMSTELALLHEYGNSVKVSCATGRQWKNFRELIFCSLCAVALRSTRSNDDVYEAMRNVFGSDAKTKSLEALVRGAKWVNRTISLLTNTEWALRGWDTAFLAARRIRFYARFSDYSIKPEQVLMGYRGSYLEDTPDTSVPLAIPLIIQRIFQNSISLQDICKCLGYELSVIEPLQVLFDKIFQSPNNAKRRRRLEPAQSAKRQRHANSVPLLTDRASQEIPDDLHQPTLRASFSEHTLQNLFGDIPSLTDSISGLAPSNFPQASESTPQGDNVRTSDAWFSTYLDPEAGESEAPGDDPMTSGVWFSTYLDPEAGEAEALGDDPMANDMWFSTYRDSQAGESVPHRRP